MVVVDPVLALVFEGTALPPELVRMFARTPIEQSAESRAVLRDWQQGGAAWRGAVARVGLQSARLTGSPWTVVVYGKRRRPVW